MRGNGLSAEEYIAVADLDPSTADVLLAALRDRGVAAYAAQSPDPAPLDVGSVDRLYVDVAAVEQARELIDDELTAAGLEHEGYDELGLAEAADQADLADRADLADLADRADGAGTDAQEQLDFEAAFASIVAAYHRTPAVEPGRWPADEDLPAPPAYGRRRGDLADGAGPDSPTDRSAPAAPADPPGADGNPQPPVTPSAAAPGSTVGWEDLLRPAPAEPTPEPDEGYTPPPPPPLPKIDTASRFAWAGVLGGPALLFLAVLLGWHLEDWMMLVAAVAFLAGFVTLVAKLGDRDDDDGDDGAVV